MLIEFEGYRPQISPRAFVAPTAVLIGNVVVHDDASVWYGAVLRADHGQNGIVIGARSSIQDNVVIHVSHDHGTTIGEDVTVGHGAILEGCTVEDGALVGMNSVVLDGVILGRRSLLAASSSVLQNTAIPAETLAAGVPAKVKKSISGSSREWVDTAAAYYVELGERYRRQGLNSET